MHIHRAVLARQALLHLLNLILSFTQHQVRVHSGASNSSTLTSPGEIYTYTIKNVSRGNLGSSRKTSGTNFTFVWDPGQILKMQDCPGYYGTAGAYVASEMGIVHACTFACGVLLNILVSHLNLVGNVDLKRTIPHEHLAKIAREVIKWEELTPSLGLTQQDEVNIRATYRDYEDQKRQALYTWKRNKGNGATYGTLIAAAESISNQQLADGVRDLMKELQGMYSV